MSDIFINILANIIFWLGLGLLFRYAFIAGRRKAFFRLFGLEKNKRITVYLSNLWLPSMDIKPWGCIISGQEFKVTRTINNLFGSAPFTLPEMVRGLVDAFWVGKGLDVKIETSPMGRSDDLMGNMIVMGTSTKNSVRRNFIVQNTVLVTIVGEPKGVLDDKDILDNLLKSGFEIRRGKEAGQILQKQGEYNVAVIERMRDEHSGAVVFMCAGQRGDSSWMAMEYLARHWRELYKEYGDTSYARCLWYANKGIPMDDYTEPIHIFDVIP